MHLPEDFHDKGVTGGFTAALTTVKQSVTGPPDVVALHIDAHLLLLGLMYREVTRSIEAEPEDSKVPCYLRDSPLGVKELDQIVEVINSIKVPNSQ